MNTGVRSRLFLLLVSIALVLLVFELGLRIANRPLEWNFRAKAVDSDWQELVHQASKIPGLTYEMRPGHNAKAVGIRIQTNSLGMRSSPISEKKSPGTFRIAALGDSITFGFGVEQNEAYPQKLESLLRVNSHKPVEVINMGVSAYNTQEEVTFFMNKGAGLDPDLVVIQYFLNDPEFEPFDPLHAYYSPRKWWMHSNLMRLLKKNLLRLEIKLNYENDFYIYLHKKPYSQAMIDTALGRLADWAKPRQVPLIMVIFPLLKDQDLHDYAYKDLHRQVADKAGKLGYDPIDLLPVFKPYPKELLTSRTDNFHPSAFAHELCAKELVKHIERIENLRTEESGR